MNRNKITEISENMIALHKSFDRLKGVLSTGPASHYFEQIIEFYDGCMNGAKFKVGQTVYLNKAPDITANKWPGWVGCRHFLVLDAEATVENVSYYNGQYVYDLIFKDESWLKTNIEAGVPIYSIMPVSEKHAFSFAESFISDTKSGALQDQGLDLKVENQLLKEQVRLLTTENSDLRLTLTQLKSILEINQ